MMYRVLLPFEFFELGTIEEVWTLWTEIRQESRLARLIWC